MTNEWNVGEPPKDGNAYEVVLDVYGEALVTYIWGIWAFADRFVVPTYPLKIEKWRYAVDYYKQNSV